MKPIGTINIPFKDPVGTPIQGAVGGDEKGEIVILPKYREGLSDLGGWFEPHLKELEEGKTTPRADDLFHKNSMGS